MINHDGKVLVGDVWLLVDALHNHNAVLYINNTACNSRAYYQNGSQFIKHILAHYTLIHRNEKETCEDGCVICELDGLEIRTEEDFNMYKTVERSNFCPDCGKDLRSSVTSFQQPLNKDHIQEGTFNLEGENAPL